MSTCFRFATPVPFADFLEKAAKIEGLQLQLQGEGKKDWCLIDEDDNHLWAYTGDGTDTGLEVYVQTRNRVWETILPELEAIFGEILDENDERYWEDDELEEE